MCAREVTCSHTFFSTEDSFLLSHNAFLTPHPLFFNLRKQLKTLVESEIAKRKSHAKSHHLQLLETEELRMLVGSGDKRIERLSTELEEERRGMSKERRERKKWQEKAESLERTGRAMLDQQSVELRSRELEANDLRERNKELQARLAETDAEQYKDVVSDEDLSPTAAALRRSINLSNSVLASIFPNSPSSSGSRK